MQDIRDFRLGETNELLSLESAADHRAATLAMVQQAKRSLHIFSRDLEALIYDNADFEEAVAQLARSSQHSYIHILVQDSNRASQSGHRLVNLAHRLSSKIEIRKPIKEYADINRAYFVVDETGYISRALPDRYEAVGNFCDRLTARNLVTSFDEIWARSQQDVQLRRVYL